MHHGDSTEPVRSKFAPGEYAARVDVDVPHRLITTQDALDPTNPVLRQVIDDAGRDDPARCLICIDSGLLDAQPDLPDRIAAYANHHADVMLPVGSTMVVPGGETCKQDPDAYQRIVRAIHDHAICRHSFVIVLGGGAVLDAVGFAAAISHRGVRLVRFPTTTLAQDDSGVGVKNGINAFGKKNFIGSFTVPWAVINDSSFLGTLDDRDWRAGFSEAVKVALLKDAELFEAIEGSATRIRRRDVMTASAIIAASAELHLEHIVTFGDPFELTEARPLDFGHWAAHKLEQMTDFTLRHGEAVSIGLAIDVTYAALLDMLPWTDRDRIVTTLENLGLPIRHHAMHDQQTLFEGLKEFREHLGGQLTIPLLTGIGKPIDVHSIDLHVMQRAIDMLADGESRVPSTTVE
ncbi:MAG: 3-dehydroquinate synthase [Planctomycetota bacterium]